MFRLLNLAIILLAWALNASAFARPLDCIVVPRQVADLAFGTGGIVARLLVDRGDVVRKGDVVAFLDSAIEDANLAIAKARIAETATLENARAQLVASESKLRRSQLLESKQVMATSKIEEVQAEYESARLKVEEQEEVNRLKQLDVERAQAALSLRRIVSPFDGVIVDRHAAPGEYVENRRAVTIAQIDANTGDAIGATSTDYYNGRDRTDLGGDHDDNLGDHSKATITWNADVILDKIDAERFLTIDGNGFITAANGISVDGWEELANEGIFFPLVGYHTGSVIHVDDILENALPGMVVFKATQDNVTIFPSGDSYHENESSHHATDKFGNSDTPVANDSHRNILQGDQGTWYVGLGSGVIAIDNYSNNTLEINNIETVTTFEESFFPTTLIDINDAAGFKFIVSPFYGKETDGDAPNIQITNHTIQGGGDIIINGHIDNPVGLTYIDAGAGQILENDNQTGLITTYKLTMYAGGNIGTPATGNGFGDADDFTPPIPVKVEFVQSPGRVPHASIFSSNGTIIIDVSSRLRDLSVSSVTVEFDELSAPNGGISATFHHAANDAEFQWFLYNLSPEAGIEVKAQSSTGGSNPAGITTAHFYRSYYYPDGNAPLSTDVTSAFGANFGATAPAVYNIHSLSGTNSLVAAEPDVTINRPFIIFPFPLFDLFQASHANGFTDLSVPTSMTASETPLDTLLGDANTTFFGVTESDIAVLAAAAVANAPDVLVDDFVSIDPSLTRVDRVTKPQILWQ